MGTLAKFFAALAACWRDYMAAFNHDFTTTEESEQDWWDRQW